MKFHLYKQMRNDFNNYNINHRARIELIVEAVMANNIMRIRSEEMHDDDMCYARIVTYTLLFN